MYVAAERKRESSLGKRISRGSKIKVIISNFFGSSKLSKKL